MFFHHIIYTSFEKYQINMMKGRKMTNFKIRELILPNKENKKTKIAINSKN